MASASGKLHVMRSSRSPTLVRSQRCTARRWCRLVTSKFTSTVLPPSLPKLPSANDDPFPSAQPPVFRVTPLTVPGGLLAAPAGSVHVQHGLAADAAVQQ